MPNEITELSVPTTTDAPGPQPLDIARLRYELTAAGAAIEQIQSVLTGLDKDPASWRNIAAARQTKRALAHLTAAGQQFVDAPPEPSA